MICYIMCILLWIAYLWLDCMVVAYAFEPRRDSVRQAGIILGLMAAQLPAEKAGREMYGGGNPTVCRRRRTVGGSDGV